MRILLTLLLLVGLAACQVPEPSLTDADKAQIEQAITDAMTAIFESASEIDEEGAFRSFHPDGLIASSGRLFSVDEYRYSYRDGTKGVDRREFPNSRIVVKIQSPTLALATMTSGLVDIDTLGVSTDTADCVVSTVWAEEEGSWRVIQWHRSWGMRQ